jgi:hypothetical protein
MPDNASLAKALRARGKEPEPSTDDLLLEEAASEMLKAAKSGDKETFTKALKALLESK